MNEQTNMGVIMKELIANSVTADIKKNPDFVQKAIKDILSEPVEIRKTKLKTGEFDEKKLILLPAYGIRMVLRMAFSCCDPFCRI